MQPYIIFIRVLHFIILLLSCVLRFTRFLFNSESQLPSFFSFLYLLPIQFRTSLYCYLYNFKSAIEILVNITKRNFLWKICSAILYYFFWCKYTSQYISQNHWTLRYLRNVLFYILFDYYLKKIVLYQIQIKIQSIIDKTKATKVLL